MIGTSKLNQVIGIFVGNDSFAKLSNHPNVYFRKEEDAHGKERYERTFKFETFSDKIAATDYSIVYQLAGNTSLHKVGNLV